MRTFIFTFALKCLLPLFFIFPVRGMVSAQTFVNLKPAQLAEIIAARYLNFSNVSSTETIVSRIDSVLWSGKTIGYIVHFETGGIAVIPKIRETTKLKILKSFADCKSANVNGFIVGFTLSIVMILSRSSLKKRKIST